VAIQATADGSQTINVPLYSTDAQEIVAVESWGGLGNAILAIGEADLGNNSFLAGSAPLIGLTMQMNVALVGMMTGTTDANGDAQAFNAGSSGFSFNFSGSSGVCSPGQTVGPFYAFAADPSAVSRAITSPPATDGHRRYRDPCSRDLHVRPDHRRRHRVVGHVSGLQNVGYTETFPTVPSGSAGATFQFSVTNPAGAIANDYNNNGGLYPGVYAIEQDYAPVDELNLGSIATNPGITSIDVSGFCD